MKKKLFACAFLITSLFYTQTINELNNEIQKIKTEISGLKLEIQSVKSQNLYLKKVLDINTPILEQKNNNNEYRIIKVIGNKNDKSISISLIIEAKDENKTTFLQDFSIIDLEGNQYELDFVKSSSTIQHLSLNVPINLKIIFKDVFNEPKIIKLLKFSSKNEPAINPFNYNKSNQEFRDLNVSWE